MSQAYQFARPVLSEYYLHLLLIYCLLQLAALCLCLTSHSWLVRGLDGPNFLKGRAGRGRAATLCRWHDRIGPLDLRSMPTLASACRIYRLAASLTPGDLCDVHYALSADRAFLLKTARRPGCDGLLAKERQVLGQLQRQAGRSSYGEYFPVPTELFRSGNQLVSAFEWREGFFSAGEILRHYRRGVDGRHVAWMFNRVLEALGFVHQQGWIHGAVLPPHLLFHAASHGLQLIGWTHAERRDTPLRVVPRKFKAWYPPECRRRAAATPATDIYLAAKSMIWLAGGNPHSDSMSDHLPSALRRCLLECISDRPSRRPQHAWSLHQEFRQLLEDVYGPPQFCYLDMS